MAIPPAPTPEPREADPQTPGDVAGVAAAVAALRTAVEDVRKGLLDRATIEQIAGEVLAKQNEAPGGFRPDDRADTPNPRALGGTLQQRMAQIHTRSARQVATMIRRDEADVREFQARCDELVLLGAVLAASQQSDAERRNFDVRTTRYYQDEFLPAMRAIDTQTAGEGQEWVPTALSSNLIDRVNLELRVAALFPMVVMPTAKFELPALAVTRVRAGSHAEQTADTGQTKFKVLTPGSRKVTLIAKKFAGRILVSKESEEDAIVAVLPLMGDELVEFLAADVEDTIINGDTTGTHMDDDVTDADDPRKNWDGLRKLTPAGAKRDGGSAAKLTVADLRANRKLMGKYGITPTRIGHLVSMAGYIQLLDDDRVVTLDKYGPSATILTGELGKVDGVALVVSEYVRQDLNATGVFDGTTETQQIALTAHRRGYLLGERRGMTIEYLRELYAESDQDAVIGSCRKAFTAAYEGEPASAETYNIDS